jgi:hypothetical protein
MRSLRALLYGQRGVTFEGVALGVAMITVAAIAVTDFLDRAANNQGLSSFSILRDNRDLIEAVRQQVQRPKAAVASQSSVDIDPTPTASIAANKIVLDPCTGKQK